MDFKKKPNPRPGVQELFFDLSKRTKPRTVEELRADRERVRLGDPDASPRAVLRAHRKAAREARRDARKDTRGGAPPVDVPSP